MGTEITKKDETFTGLADLRKSLDAVRKKVLGRLPNSTNETPYLTGVLDAFRTNQDLWLCSPESVKNALLESADIELPVGGQMPLGYLVPYKRECRFQPSYRGLIELARRCGSITQHVVRAVHLGDQFRFVDGVRPEVSLVRGDGERTWNTLTHVYAHFALSNGYELVQVMDKAEIEEHRDKTVKSSGADTPWKKWPIPMAMKTVVRQALTRGEIQLRDYVNSLGRPISPGQYVEDAPQAMVAIDPPARPAQALSDSSSGVTGESVDLQTPPVDPSVFEMAGWTASASEKLLEANSVGELAKVVADLEESCPDLEAGQAWLNGAAHARRKQLAKSQKFDQKGLPI